MNAERLLAHYHAIADAPDAIVRLRSFILNLAVRGKLVPRDASDEPASELLKAIVAKRKKLAEAGIVRPSKVLPPPGSFKCAVCGTLVHSWSEFDHFSDWRQIPIQPSHSGEKR